jgi:PhoH-like ATPase
VRKLYVLDTNVLLHDPRAIFKFEDNEVVLPIYVIEEVDHFKRDASELGRNARTLARFIDELREQSAGALQQGVTLPSGGSLRVPAPPASLAESNGRSADHKILAAALLERDEHPEMPTIFVTMDSNLRIRADALGLRAETYEGGKIREENLLAGITRIEAPGELVDMLGKRTPVPLASLEPQPTLHPNTCVMLRDHANPKHSALGRFIARDAAIAPLRVGREGMWGIRPRNVEQSFACDLLLDDKVQLLTLVGRAGTGKTLLAVAAGLQKVLHEGSYARLLVSRPIFPLGRDVGYLPGTLEEKLNPWMRPIFDNLEYIFTTGGAARFDTGRSYEELLSAGTIQVEPLTYIRGRTLPNQFLIVDEAQNLTPHEVKTIITRCGSDTKIVLTGDPDQIDNPYVDAASNGLATVAERFKDHPIAGHVTLTKGERSELAEIASELL